jgi:O-antigen/teichoic acid export membrane protein
MGNGVFSTSDTVRQAKIVAIAKVSGAFVNLTAQLVVARYLGIQDYAVFTLFIAASSLLTLLSMYGIDRVCYRVVPPLRMQNRWREISAFAVVSLLARLVLVCLLLTVCAYFPALGFAPALAQQLALAQWPLVCFVLAMSMTDSLSVFCSGVGKQAAQSTALLLTGVGRSATIIYLLTVGENNSLNVTLWAFVVAEILFATALATVLAADLLRQHQRTPSLPFQLGFRVRDALVEGGTTQLSYVLRLPFGGPFLRLVVGSFAPPSVTAAYGFFQSLADRIYQFLPAIMVKGVIEPALSADYASRQDIARVAAVVAVLLKSSCILIAALLAGVLGVGEPLINRVTGGKYGAEILIAALVCVQLMSQVLGEALWIALNPVGRVVKLNKAWYGVTLASGVGLLLAAQLQSTWLLLTIASLPYFAVALWLRWISKEPMLLHGIGLGATYKLLLPCLAAAGTAHAALQLIGDDTVGLATAAAVTAGVFLTLLSIIGFFTRQEVEMARHFSPRIATLVKLFAVRR